jgi:hypothetical protein
MKDISNKTMPERFLEIGKEYAREKRYDEAIEFFSKASLYQNTIGEISHMYDWIVRSVAACSNPDRGLTLGKLLGERRDESVIERLTHYMEKAIDMHFQGKLPKEDLLEMEKLINKIPFSEMKASEKTEFQEAYNAFKTYCIEVYAQDK